MFKYVILFYVVFFCDSIQNGMTGDYDVLIFTQRTPGAAYMYIQYTTFYEEMVTTDVLDYFTEYWILLDPRKWIIHELSTFLADGEKVTECQDFYGRSLTFEDAVPPEAFREELRTKWPAICTNLTEFDFWELSYDLFGSCIKPTPLEYFEFAMELLANFNIADILERYRILPGRRYTLNHIIDSIRHALGVHPVVKCYRSQNRRGPLQFLMDIQICFDRGNQLINCNYTVAPSCERNLLITYAGWPRNR